MARVEADSAAAKKATDDLGIVASEQLEELRVDRLSNEEKELELIRGKINFWSEYRDTVEGAEEIFQELAERRNELLEENARDL